MGIVYCELLVAGLGRYRKYLKDRVQGSIFESW